MKYIKTYEFSFPFKKKEVVKEEEEEPLIEIPVSWTGAYVYNGIKYYLSIGEYTNKGFITDIIDDIHTVYKTETGSFLPDELTVFKGNKEDLDTFIDSKKFNL